MRVLLLALGLSAFVTSAALADPDVEKGEKIFKRCQACHVADKKQNRVGPYLLGLFGRKAGTAEGFNYSDAMKNSGVTWNEETLDKYLADPKAFVPGNKMAFPGLKKEDERQDVIAYLKKATAG